MSKTYIGGGKLFYAPVGSEDYKEWGLIKSLKLALKQESKEIFGWSSGYKQVEEEAVISKEYTMSFESNDLSNEVLEIAFNAKTTKEDGKVKLQLGTTQSKIFKFKFIGNNHNNMEVIFHKVMIKSDVDLSLIDDDYKALSFEGKCQNDGEDTVTIITKEDAQVPNDDAGDDNE